MTRRRLAYLLFATSLLGSACHALFEVGECTDDPSARHAAIYPVTGECVEFDSSCDVPSSWADCGPKTCESDAACPPDSRCDNGACKPINRGCTSDEECVATQYCDLQGTLTSPTTDLRAPEPVTGVCRDNPRCSSDAECPQGQWCEGGFRADGAPPTDSDALPQGRCTRAPRPGTDCLNTSMCQVGEICPAEYGICSDSAEKAPPGGVGINPPCISTCQPLCYGDSDCTASERCNHNEVCGSPNTGAPITDQACGGWCVPSGKPIACVTSSDCQSGDLCPAAYQRGAPAVCMLGCTYDGVCAQGERCNVTEVCGQVSTGSSGSGGAGDPLPGVPVAPPPCYGWCVATI
jgi:hypothetical protein